MLRNIEECSFWSKIALTVHLVQEVILLNENNSSYSGYKNLNKNLSRRKMNCWGCSAFVIISAIWFPVGIWTNLIILCATYCWIHFRSLSKCLIFVLFVRCLLQSIQALLSSSISIGMLVMISYWCRCLSSWRVSSISCSRCCRCNASFIGSIAMFIALISLSQLESDRESTIPERQ